MERSVLKNFIKTQGLRQSGQRDRVVETFLALKGHASAEELLGQVRKKDKKIGLTTVYRTLKLLTQCGLATERKFNRQVSTFEPARLGQHHDHLICLKCGRILEFENKAIETLQEAVARDQGFIITHHILELYGTCLDCFQNTGKKLKKK
ncbi:MAG: transcriptional repressor [Thermodesulfobacteriota bacterium]|jgi:Fur family transcriptional regulator, ferric uptake regulator